jgi:Transposase Tn5 dimerisation domain
LSLKRRPHREAREAEVELRFSPITLKRPRRAIAQPETLTVFVVDVFEPHPPAGQEAVRWIGQLGGFLARNGDGEPGVKVLWRGWTHLQDIVQTWSIFHPP